MVQPLGNDGSFSPTDNCDCLNSNLPRNASHRWREREHRGWIIEVDFTASYGPLHLLVLNISSVGRFVLGDMFVGLHECQRIWWVQVYGVCVSVNNSGGLRKLHRHCEDSAGSSVPFVFARSSFPPTAGRQARLAASLAFTGWLG